MKKNSKKNNNYFANVETSQKTKKKFKINNSLLKAKQIPIAGIHSIFSALNNKNRKLHYLITTYTNLSKWKDTINKLKLILFSFLLHVFRVTFPTSPPTFELSPLCMKIFTLTFTESIR